MPYYFWTGINFEGIICYGRKFAQSINDLDLKLIKIDIGLIKTKQIKQSRFVLYRAQLEKDNLINHLAILLKANIRLHKALNILLKNIKNDYLRSVIEDIEYSVYQGSSFSNALEAHRDFFGQMTCSIATAGEKSSNLGYSFELLDKHNQEMSKFNQKLHSFLLTPILTFIFFLAVIFCIFIFVIPRFEIFFSSFDLSLYPYTRLMLNISKFIRSTYFFISIGTIFIAYMFIKVLFSRAIRNLKHISHFRDKICLYIPLFGKLNLFAHHYRILQTLGILLSSGVHLVDALRVTIDGVNNLEVLKVLENILYQVKSGRSLSYALSGSSLFSSEELIALIDIGESSGSLSSLIMKASEIYQIRVYEMFNKFITLLQPLLLIMLGLFIAGLIFSIYTPIFTLTSVIH